MMTSMSVLILCAGQTDIFYEKVYDEYNCLYCQPAGQFCRPIADLTQPEKTISTNASRTDTMMIADTSDDLLDEKVVRDQAPVKQTESLKTSKNSAR